MIGNILVTLALLGSIFSMLMYYFTSRGYENTLKPARYSFHFTTITIIIASAMLLQAILTHQYQYKYVFNYSNSDLSLGLLMSTFYAGQEGSFMLWLLLTSIIGVILMEYTSKREGLEPAVMMIFALATAFLALMVNPLLKSPFNYLWSEAAFISTSKINPIYLSAPFLQNFIFSDNTNNQMFVKVTSELVGMLKASGIPFENFVIAGKGLNPLLQNFWMQIHPPMLFTGFALSTVPFAFAFASLIKNDYKSWVRHALPWTLASMMILGLAIMLGGYWAYGVLGWGGYWGWDPVENSSFVPWLVGTALVHTMLVQKKTQARDGIGRYARTNLILGMLTYLLVLYSTFLTRSGILGDASVHSFVDPGMTVYLLLIAFVTVFTILGFATIAWRWKSLNELSVTEDNLLSKELALFTGAVTLIAAAIIVLAGTSSPIFGTAVETRFYNEMNLPIAIIIGLLNGLSLVMKWRSSDEKNLIKQLSKPFVITIILTSAIVFLGGVNNIMLAILTFSTTFSLVVNVEIAAKIIKGRKSHIGAYVAHMGLAFFLLGVIGTGGFTKEKSIDLVKNQPTEVLGYKLTFTGYMPIDNGKKYAFNVLVDDGSSSYVVSPVMYVSDFNNSLMREPDIMNRLTSDLYIEPLGYDDNRGNSSKGQNFNLNKGESITFNGAKITFKTFKRSENAIANMQSGKDFYIGADIVIEKDGKTYSALPKFQNKNGKRSYTSDIIEEADLSLKLTSLNAAGSIGLEVSSLSNPQISTPREVLSVQASVKPFINLVWLGTIVMVLGFFIAVKRRINENK